MEETLYLPLFIAFAINLVIIYFIVKSATRSNEVVSELRMQTELLAKMTQAAGVSDEIIKDILNPLKKIA